MSVNPRGNRGGMGWQEPPMMPKLSEADLRELMSAMSNRAPGYVQYADAGDAAPAPVRNPLAIHDDPIDMIEIDGVWMCAADARFAHGIDFGKLPGQVV
jgi:hypothetical protein